MNNFDPAFVNAAEQADLAALCGSMPNRGAALSDRLPHKQSAYVTQTLADYGHQSNFQRVAAMNTAFGNPKGDAQQIDLDRIRSQCRNIGHEFAELLAALGGNAEDLKAMLTAMDAVRFGGHVDLEQVRDSLCDTHVFAYGAHHLMGIDADRDMNAVVDGVMTRFIKDEPDRLATIAKHAAKGVKDVYFEGEFPTMVMKSASNQPDAPRGKFLKSASFSEPAFYGV